jgi:ABC-type multidrug transport system permease subunit
MLDFVQDLGWVLLFTLVAGFVGSILFLFVGTLIPKFLNRLTPRVDEEKEIAQGNRAVATYFGTIVGACIIGVAIVVAAALVAGVVFLVK